MKKTCFLMLIFIVSLSVWANTPIKSFEEEYNDYLVLTGKASRSYLTNRAITKSNYELSETFWKNTASTKKSFNNGIDLTVYNPRIYVSENTNQPYGQNDGSLWQGKGLNMQFSTGITLSYRGLSLTFKPELNYSQNLEFKTMHDIYGYFWGTLDLVQRFGDKPLLEFNFGDTVLRYTGKFITAAFGTEYTWLGPNYLNSILMSNNASTYPRFELGLIPTDIHIPWTAIKLGKFEAMGSLGVLTSSDYYSVKKNNKTFLALVSLGYQPSFIDNLTFGANYAAHFNYSKKGLIEMIKTVPAGHNLAGDGKMSYTIDWLVPSAGLEVYTEYGKDDYSYFSFYHTAVVQIGFKKSINILANKGIFLELIGEAGNMEMSRDAITEWSYNFYTHGGDPLSYSNNGQLLGAGTAYAGVSYYLKINAFYRKGMSSIFAQLQHPDNNYTYNRLIADFHGNKANWDRKNTSSNKFRRSLDFGINTTYFINDNLTLEAGFVDQIIVNNYYQEDFIEGVDKIFKYYKNFQFSFGMNYSI